MTITLPMAWRNLWRHKRRTWITISAMVFTNVILVFAISLQFGSYRMMIDNSLMPLTGHLQIQQKNYNDQPQMRHSIDSILALANDVRRQISSNKVAARGIAFAMLSSKERSHGVQVTGVEWAFEPNVSSLPGLISKGSYFNNDSAENIILGSVLARNLRVDIGDEITLLGSGYDGSFAAAVLNVSGIFTSGMPEIDRNMAQLPIGYFDTLFGMEGRGQSIVIDATDLSEVAGLKKILLAGLGQFPELHVLDWTELLPGLKQAIEADFASAWFMYGVLILLVAFSVLNTQLMSVLERTREFGMIMALGVKPSLLGRMVLIETAMMSALGLLIGVLLGSVLTYYLSIVGLTYPGMDEMAQRFNLPDRMYPAMSMLSIMLGPAVIFIFNLVASLYPALRLYYLQPITAMRGP